MLSGPGCPLPSLVALFKIRYAMSPFNSYSLEQPEITQNLVTVDKSRYHKKPGRWEPRVSAARNGNVLRGLPGRARDGIEGSARPNRACDYRFFGMA